MNKKILNYLPAVGKLKAIAAENIWSYDLLDHEIIDSIDSKIDNFDLIIVSAYIKNKFYQNNEKIVSGRDIDWEIFTNIAPVTFDPTVYGLEG